MTGVKKVLGVVMVVASLALGITTVNRADQRSLVVVAARDLPAGITVTEDDLALAPVFLGSSARHYAESAEDVRGQVVLSPLRQGELVPLVDSQSQAMRIVALPMRADHLPTLTRGDLVDVWAVRVINGGVEGAPALIGTGLAVAEVDSLQRGAMTATIALAVDPREVSKLVAAIEGSLLTLVRR